MKDYIVSLVASTPSEVFVPGRKITITINKDKSVRVDYFPGVKSTLK